MRDRSNSNRSGGVCVSTHSKVASALKPVDPMAGLRRAAIRSIFNNLINELPHGEKQSMPVIKGALEGLAVYSDKDIRSAINLLSSDESKLLAKHFADPQSMLAKCAWSIVKEKPEIDEIFRVGLGHMLNYHRARVKGINCIFESSAEPRVLPPPSVEEEHLLDDYPLQMNFC